MDRIITMHVEREIRSEEQLIPIVRAKLAEGLAREGFHVKEIAKALNVTQPAVSQYLKRKRGTALQSVKNIDSLVEPLTEKLIIRIRSGLGGIETAELLDMARQVLVLNKGRTILQSHPTEPKRNKSIEFLRARLQLELTAAEKYLELANKTSDDHTKLLLRMIASDSIRHGDVVSQIMSWLESGSPSATVVQNDDLLKSMLSIEDSANEANLKENVEVNHPVARLLLEWIDVDEKKHERIISRMLRLNRNRS